MNKGERLRKCSCTRVWLQCTWTPCHRNNRNQMDLGYKRVSDEATTSQGERVTLPIAPTGVHVTADVECCCTREVGGGAQNLFALLLADHLCNSLCDLPTESLLL